MVTTDNWYLSLSLCEELSRRNIRFLGTVRKNRTFVPKRFAERVRNRPLYSTIFGYRDTATLLSYQAKKSAAVILLTSVPEILEDTIAPNDNLHHPEAIHLYNKTK